MAMYDPNDMRSVITRGYTSGAGQPGYQNGGFNPGPYQTPTQPGFPKQQPVPTYPNTPSPQQDFTNTSGNGTGLNIDAYGNLYGASGQRQMSAMGQPIQYSGVSGQYQPPQGGGASYAGTGVFTSDPSTAPFEQLLNKLVNNLSTQQTPADYGQAVNQLNTYLKQLNGPVYTPDQANLLQTQALDPLSQQHDAARQQTIQHLASQGIGPSSGITQQALADVDRQFQQMRTQTQSQFAANAVGLQRQNQQLAAQLAPAISGFEQQQMNLQDQRNQQAAALAMIIPQLAQSRVGAAQGAVNPINPASLLSLLNSFNQTGNQQGAAYGNAIGGLVPSLFGF